MDGSCLLFERLFFWSPLSMTTPPTQLPVNLPRATGLKVRLCSAHTTLSIHDSGTAPFSSSFCTHLCHLQDSHTEPWNTFCSVHLLQKLFIPLHLLPTLLQRGKELTPFLRRQPCRENAGGSSFHTLLILPKKKGHLSAWEDCGTSAWGHFYSRSRRKQPPSPLFPQVLPLTGEDGREAASLLRPCGLHSGGGSRVWLLEAGLGALSSLLHSLAALLCPYWVY